MMRLRATAVRSWSLLRSNPASLMVAARLAADSDDSPVTVVTVTDNSDE